MPLDYEEQKKKANLWRCTCPDDGNHTDTDYHASYCGYASWYERQNFDDDEGENE